MDTLPYLSGVRQCHIAAEAAANYYKHANCSHNTETAFQGSGRNKLGKHHEPLKAEITQLKRELARVTEERGILKNADVVLCESAQVKYAFIQPNRSRYSLQSLRRVLHASRSG